MSLPFHFEFMHGRLVRMQGRRSQRLLAGRQNSPRQLAANVESKPIVNHIRLPYLDGSRFKLGRHLGSGIDKAAYHLLDESGIARSDVVLKVAKHQDHCDDNGQCRREIELWSWLVEVDHPLRYLFASVEAIIENVEVSEMGETTTRTCYVSEYARKDQSASGMFTTKEKLKAYFGIYDLHDNNMGVTEDGRCVVIDYGLYDGFDKAQRQWQEARNALGDDASPQDVLDSITPEFEEECDDGEPLEWCSSCETEVRESHCRCTCCRDERRGGLLCYACQTVTNEESRLTDETVTEIRCHTCLSLAREQRHPSQCHPEGSIVWRMHNSCKCDECRNARNCFELARGRKMHTYPESKWCYRPQCPCEWCKRARSENARLYENVRVSVHRIESAPPLAALGDNILKSPLQFIKDIGGKS